MKKGFAMSDVYIYLFIIIIAVVIFALFLIQKERVGNALTEQQILLESQVQQRTRVVLQGYYRTRLDTPLDVYVKPPPTVPSFALRMDEALPLALAKKSCREWINTLNYQQDGDGVFTKTNKDQLCDAVVKRSILYFKSLCGENFYLLLRYQGKEETIGNPKNAGFEERSIPVTSGGFSARQSRILTGKYEFGQKNKAYLMGEESIPDLSVMLLCQETKGEVRA